MGGQHVVHHQEIALEPGEINRMRLKTFADAAQIGIRDGTAIALGGVHGEVLDPAVNHVQQRLAILLWMVAGMKLVRLIEPHPFAGLRVNPYPLPCLADPKPAVDFPKYSVRQNHPTYLVLCT